MVVLRERAHLFHRAGLVVLEFEAAVAREHGRADVKRRHAGLGELEVVGAEVGAAQVRGRRRQAQAHAPRHFARGRVQRAALGPGHAHVARAADEVQAVEVEVGGGLRQRPGRIRDPARGAQQALLFGAGPQEDQRAFGRMRACGLGHGQQGGGAGAVVDRAVPDVVRLAVVRIDAQVVPVRRHDHRFAAQFGVAAGHDAGHVVFGDFADRALDVGL